MRLLLISILLAIAPCTTSAQLTAGFNMDKGGDCSPATIRFFNASTGTGTGSTYLWDFGNGNTSTLKDPSAVFIDEGTYTVSLTVRDNGTESVRTSTVMVYKKPVVGFDVQKPEICLPSPAVFNSTSAPGDGSITKYIWDYGDGQTQQVSASSISHQYQLPQTATVSLTAVNSYGCSNTIVKLSVVKINPPLTASFSADKTIFCSAPAEVRFTNTTTGPGLLSYSWDFGDGTTSSSANPTHRYTADGIYTVQLTVNNNIGCTNSSVRTTYIRVGGFTAAFTEPATICLNTPFSILNNSSPAPEQNEWFVDGSLASWNTGNNGLYHTFYTEGEHTVELRTQFGPCMSTVAKKIIVRKGPDLNGFLVDIKSLCGSPTQVDFRDTTAASVAWQWTFDGYSTQSNQQAPSYTFTYDATYNVRLQSTNAAGCTSITSKPVSISRPIVGIYLDSGPQQGCTNLTAPFSYRSTEPLTSIRWDFGDQLTSTEAAPVHTFAQPGDYWVKLTYTTVSGCTGTSTIWSPIQVRQKPVANFIAPQSICGNTTTYFDPSPTTGYVTSFIWDFGDNTWQQYGTNNHQYWNEGSYDVTLVAYNGICNDTITQPAIVRVNAPFAKISGFSRTCDGDRGSIVFGDDSKLGTSWKWSFGDGQVVTYNSYQPTVTHQYTATGSYQVKMSVTNGNCTVSDSVLVHVLLKQKPQLSLTTTATCQQNQEVPMNLSGLYTFPSGFYPWYQFRLYDDQGVDRTLQLVLYSYNLPYQFYLRGFTAGEYKLRIVSTSAYFNCNDTSNYVTLRVNGPKAVMNTLPAITCFKIPVSFKDLSVPNDVPLKSAWWEFGDGFNQTTAPGATITHTYANPGSYQVTLRSTDEGGCTSEVKTVVNITGPKTAFSFSPSSPVQLSTPVTFINGTNSSNALGSTWQWLVNNIPVSVSSSPTQVFPVAGDYTVKLIAVNPDNGCSDTSTNVLTVKDFRTGFNTNMSFVGDHGTCPPVLAKFTNTSINYTRLVWDFGDGYTLTDQQAPAHIYSEPGTYYVTLKIYGYNGLQETQYDTVRVERPAATLAATVLQVCPGGELSLHAPASERVSMYHWDFGDGSLKQSTDSVAVNTFNSPGTYTPTLVVRDAVGCAFAVKGPVLTVHPNAVAAITPQTAVVCKATPVLLSASGGSSYVWSPNTGLTGNFSNAVYALPSTPSTYQLMVTDQNGCRDSASVFVDVAQPIELKGTPETDLCTGSSIQLKVTGAEGIHWTGDTSGLDDPSLASPVASPLNSIIYAATAGDVNRCYLDTFFVKVNVRPVPVINAGPDLQVLYGSENRLNASGSSDVVRWNWTPSTYLGCTNCAAPVSRPFDDMLYIVTGTTAYGCTSKDSVFIKASCAETNIFIPTAFSPNHDGTNDVLMINGYGVSRIRSFRIFNRWGNLIVEHRNFLPGDNSRSWNGIYKGIDAPAGAYVYIAELECAAGELFTRKGTFMLIR